MFIKDKVGAHEFGSNGYEMAAAVRLKRELKLQEVLAELDQIDFAVPREPTKSLGSIQIEGHKCFRFPSGTFLHPIRKIGRLRFIKDGETIPKGINVGVSNATRHINNQEDREAVFTLDGISKRDLINGKLLLELRPATFFVTSTKEGTCAASISLQKTDGSFSTKPIEFDAIEFETSKFEFDRKLEGTNSKGEPKTIDLLDDLVDQGELDVVFKTLEDEQYLGFDANRFNLKKTAYDYLVIRGRDLLLAQSESTMQMMLSQAEEHNISELGKELDQAGQEIVVAGEIKTDTERDSFIQFLNAIQLNQFFNYLPRENFSLQGIVEVGERTNAKLQVTLAQSDLASSLGSKLKLDLKASNPADPVVADFGRQLVMEELSYSLTVGWNNLADAFKASPGKPTTLSDAKVDHDTLARHLRSIVNKFYEEIEVDASGDTLTVSFRQNHELDSNSVLDQLALASLELRYSDQLKAEMQYSLSSRVHRRVTSRLGSNFAAWLRRAHEDTFNKSHNFGPAAYKYQWVRRGINVLLDGAEANPESVDLLWMAANFIARKFGKSDEQRSFQKLFANDIELQKRLAKWVDIEKTKSNGQIESWLVAKSLFQYCIDQSAEGKKVRFDPFDFNSRPARALMGFGEELNARGEYKRARLYWATTEDKLHQLEDQAGVVDEKETLLGRWLWQAKFEQTDAAQAIWKHINEAKSEIDLGDRKKAHESYGLALVKIHEVLKRQPNQEKAIFNAYEDVVNAYVRGIKHRKFDEDPQLKTMLKSFKDPEKTFEPEL